MSRLSKHIAQKYIDRLPRQEQYYKLDELRSRGFPLFMIRRIQLEVERNLAESIVPPQTDWANMKVPAVQEAWDRFLNAIRSDARLPASYARSVLETVTEDIVDLLVQPRKNLPELIFGSSKELSFDEVSQRVQAIVVYRHFATLIIRYMERKELKKLTKDQCSLIVARADEKLTAHYTPLNWAQMLEPLFTILDEQIDSSLLHLFFEDKKMPRIARSFDLMNRSLNRAQLIEVLSSPELLNFEGYEEDQSDLFEGGAEPQSDPPPVHPAVQKEEFPEPDDEEENEEEPSVSRPSSPMEDEEAEGDEEGDPIISGFHKGRTVRPPSAPEPEDGEEADSLNAIFHIEENRSAPDPLAAEEETEVDADDDEGSLNAMFLNDEESASDEEPGALIESEPEPDSQSVVASGQEQHKEKNNPGTDVEGGTPMWERFLDPDRKAEIKRQEEEEEDDSVADGFIEEPIIDLTKDEGPDSADIGQIHGLLEDDRTRFVEEIFRGSDTAYEDAVKELAGMEDWRTASRYIEKEVFKRNLVDMYSETAVDFTDRLQTYYIKATKPNRS